MGMKRDIDKAAQADGFDPGGSRVATIHGAMAAILNELDILYANLADEIEGPV